MPALERKILILGGTGDAARLAELACAAFGAEAVTTSLAGVTRAPRPVPGRLRRGGFGGAGAMADYLRAEGITALVDATHPFATQISAHAKAAAAAAGVPSLALVRRPWEPGPGDRWTMVGDMAAAAADLNGRPPTVFLAIGRKELKSFFEVEGFKFVVRLVEDPRNVLPLKTYVVVIGRGPFAVADEIALFQKHGVGTIVCKASGGDEGTAKLAAARDLRLPVIMIRRPPPPEGPTADGPESAIAWLRGQ
ncbi:MAG: cobalt-precorrin-6A reductase [Alphaproteobacteria bacterium]|nr:cobalt-precorrin-6A reductase [Alphaproteobacteria bacterium]